MGLLGRLPRGVSISIVPNNFGKFRYPALIVHLADAWRPVAALSGSFVVVFQDKDLPAADRGGGKGTFWFD
jgi:hypothetical protein